jgi:hypothetical protein
LFIDNSDIRDCMWSQGDNTDTLPLKLYHGMIVHIIIKYLS